MDYDTLMKMSGGEIARHFELESGLIGVYDLTGNRKGILFSSRTISHNKTVEREVRHWPNQSCWCVYSQQVGEITVLVGVSGEELVFGEDLSDKFDTEKIAASIKTRPT